MNIKEDWNANHFISGKDTNAGGVMIIIEDNFEFEIYNKIVDSEGRFIILDIEFMGVARLLLVNLYAPNEDDPNFFKDIFSRLEDSDTKNLIIVGDWNLVLDFDKDTINYKKHNNPKSRKIVQQYIDKLDLLDIWRTTHDNTRQYTWRQNFYKKFARLDFFLISESLLDIYAYSKVKPSYRSDHNPIQLQLYISKTEKGKGVWKINNSLLLDEALTSIINKEIEVTVSIYACTPYHPDFVRRYSTEEIDLMIDIDLFWETMQAQIRGHIMTYATQKKRTELKRKRINHRNRLPFEIHT